MATMEQNEFKFPDEISEEISNEALDNVEKSQSKGKPESEIEIEVEDDTPPEDRGRTPMPKALVEELEKDELDQYDENVKTKLKQMRKVWHDERREKEAAMREHGEAITLAQRLIEENKRIKSILDTGGKEYATVLKNAATLEIENAKRAYKDAYDNGDSDKLVEAQQALQTANFKLMQAQNFRMPTLQGENNVVQPAPVQHQSVPRPDPKAEAWQERNSWFGSNRGMTAYALGVHEELKADGIEIGSDDYYRALDRTMRKRFPEVFQTSVVSEEEQKPQSSRTKSSTVVAPAVRSTASNKVRLKQSQVNLAKKLGLTPQQYVEAQLKLEAQNG